MFLPDAETAEHRALIRFRSSRGAKACAICPVGIPVHVIQRGNNRQTLFTSDKDIAAYAHWLRQGATKFDVNVHGWVFMTNHVHLLVTPDSDDAVSRLFQFLGRLYVRYFNFVYTRSGTLCLPVC